jgi:hypothetical protein
MYFAIAPILCPSRASAQHCDLCTAFVPRHAAIALPRSLEGRLALASRAVDSVTACRSNCALSVIGFVVIMTRVGTDRIRRLYGVYVYNVYTRMYGCGLERGERYTYVGIVLEGVFAGVWPCDRVPREAAANIAMLYKAICDELSNRNCIAKSSEGWSCANVACFWSWFEEYSSAVITKRHMAMWYA